MATPIREECLDSQDRPNEVSNQIQKEFDKIGCTSKVAGKPCGGSVQFNPKTVRCVCRKNSRHGGWAYDEPFSTTVFGVLNDVYEEREKKEHKKLIDLRIKDAHRKAVQESVSRGYNSKKVVGHVRPDGKAPENHTWSYFDGKWVSTCLGKRQAGSGNQPAFKKVKSTK
jgi:hypothetical protein